MLKYKKCANFLILWVFSPTFTTKKIIKNVSFFRYSVLENYGEFFFNGKSNLDIVNVTTELSLIKNALVGAMRFFFIEFWVKGVGFKYKKIIEGQKEFLILSVGYSHLIKLSILKICHITLVGRRKFFLKSTSLQEMTQFASILQKLKLPDVYKGKGLNFKYKLSILKEGKRK